VNIVGEFLLIRILTTLKPEMIRFYLISFLILLLPCGLYADFDFNQNCKTAYKKIFELKLNDASDLIRNERLLNPDNKISVYLEEYHNLIKILANQKESEFTRYNNSFYYRIREIKKGSKKSPWYHFCIAEMYIHSAMIKMNMGLYVSASVDIKSCRKHLLKNLKKFPEFEPNWKINGALQLLLGSIPENYKWFSDLIGFSGDLNTGFIEIDKYYSYSIQNSFSSTEALLIKSYLLYNYSDKPEKAYNFLVEKSDLDIKNPLILYFHALFALKSGYTDETIKLIETYKPDPNSFEIIYFDYLLGLSYLYKLDNRTVSSFGRFLNKNESMNYITSAYHKLSLYHYLTGNMNLFNDCKSSALTKSHVYVETDKEARAELTGNTVFHPVLLKARLVFDGGFYSEAEKLLQTNKELADSKDINIKGEYYYRLARINYKQGKQAEAEKAFLEVLKMEGNLKKYYVPNSALHIAYIYENLGENSQARKYYEKCLTLNNYEYRFGLRQKARAGLIRLE